MIVDARPSSSARPLDVALPTEHDQHAIKREQATFESSDQVPERSHAPELIGIPPVEAEPDVAA